MSGTAPIRWLWAALAVQLTGRLLDLRWHVTHDEFEGTSQQLEAHWLLWIGVLSTLWAAAEAWRRRALDRRALSVLLAAAGLYIAASAWHFAEHAAGNDRQVAHVLLGLFQLAIYAAAAVATARYLRSGRQLPVAPGNGPR